MQHAILGATILSLGLSGAALAEDGRWRDDGDRECGGVAAKQWMSAADAAARAKGHGFKNIREIERDDGCWEIDASDSANREVEITLHPVTGDIVELERD